MSRFAPSGDQEKASAAVSSRIRGKPASSTIHTPEPAVAPDSLATKVIQRDSERTFPVVKWSFRGCR